MFGCFIRTSVEGPQNDRHCTCALGTLGCWSPLRPDSSSTPPRSVLLVVRGNHYHYHNYNILSLSLWRAAGSRSWEQYSHGKTDMVDGVNTSDMCPVASLSCLIAILSLNTPDRISASHF